jgi:hypothetical protein
MLSHTVADQKVTISIPTLAPSCSHLLESRADWAYQNSTRRCAVVSTVFFKPLRI